MDFNKHTTIQLRNWLNSNEFSASCWLGREFEYSPDLDCIYVPLHNNMWCDEEFINHLINMGYNPAMALTIETLSFLHELGHAETNEDFDNDEWNFGVTIANMVPLLDIEPEDMMDAYWNSPCEAAANEWLIDFINNDFDAVKELDNIMKKYCIVNA